MFDCVSDDKQLKREVSGEKREVSDDFKIGCDCPDCLFYNVCYALIMLTKLSVTSD